ncbi:hypothetical protein CFO_g1856 [Ceratocystis platani]|uniref:Uncharacterized protein n=1 Tax=Ceratocystis fimbriata f. sp. platani TaxID=88771 RepID=A0A0F8B2W2_CERFI|nr:hypothetical protein CFO_g1856 [Ceratocystis platani]
MVLQGLKRRYGRATKVWKEIVEVTGRDDMLATKGMRFHRGTGVDVLAVDAVVVEAAAGVDDVDVDVEGERGVDDE